MKEISFAEATLRRIRNRALTQCPFCDTDQVKRVGWLESQCWQCFLVFDHFSGELLGGFGTPDEVKQRERT